MSAVSVNCEFGQTEALDATMTGNNERWSIAIVCVPEQPLLVVLTLMLNVGLMVGVKTRVLVVVAEAPISVPLPPTSGSMRRKVYKLPPVALRVIWVEGQIEKEFGVNVGVS